MHTNTLGKHIRENSAPSVTHSLWSKSIIPCNATNLLLFVFTKTNVNNERLKLTVRNIYIYIHLI